MNIKAILFLLLTLNLNAICQTSFWNDSTTPTNLDITNDSSSVTVGLQFYSDTAGVIAGVRFFKGPSNTGTHVGTLWSGSGTKLAEVVFSNESASGWQHALFASPVSISANTVYVISYFAPNGNYAEDDYYPWSTVNAPPLHPLNSSPAVYAYSGSVSFPGGTFNSCNYWVDPIFGTSNSVQSIGGVSSASFWTSSTIPSNISATNDGAAVTLGLQFYVDIPGYITGIRFYKGPGNNGSHIGTLWSGSGTKLSEITFSGESASGWQQANFPTPVSVAANTPYVVSYFAPQGNYSFNSSYPWSQLNAAPLHVLDQQPGVYTYGSAVSFPQTSRSTNYWVDPVFAFTGSAPAAPAATYSISGTVTGAAATLTLSGASAQSVTTDSYGNYTFSGLTNGTYVVVPSSPGYTFQPTTFLVVVSGIPVSGLKFYATRAAHSVTLNWNPSTSSNIVGYCVYRATSSSGPYYKLTPSLISSAGYTDNNIGAGQTYFYAVTAVDMTNQESGYSNIGIATVPVP
jgi:hypothetical protein